MLKKIIAAIQEWNKLRLKGLAKGITIDPPYKFLHRKNKIAREIGIRLNAGKTRYHKKYETIRRRKCGSDRWDWQAIHRRYKNDSYPDNDLLLGNHSS